MNKTVLITTFVLTLGSCALKSDNNEAGNREPADTLVMNKSNFEINKDELIWLEQKTPNVDGTVDGQSFKKIIFNNKKAESYYQNFLKRYGLTDTIEIRIRFASQEIRPFTHSEIEYLNNLPHYKALVAEFKKLKKMASAAEKKAQIQKMKAIKLQREMQQAAEGSKAGTVRASISRGKPNWISSKTWIAQDVATALSQRGVNFSDVVIYFQTFGFRSLVTSKKLSDSEMYNRYEHYGSKGLDYVEVSGAEVDRIKNFSGRLATQRVPLLIEMVKNGIQLNDEMVQTLLSNGFGIDEIATAQDENNLLYQEAHRLGKRFNNIYETHLLTMPSTVARIQTEKDMGYISDADYQKRFNDEKSAADKLYAETRNGWNASLSEYGTNLFKNLPIVIVVRSVKQGNAVLPAYLETKDQYAKEEVNRVIKTFGSVVKYNQFLDDVEKKYKFRPWARSYERMMNFFDGIPQSVGNTLAAVDIAREAIPVPTNAVDWYYMMTGYKFTATEGNFYQANQALQKWIEESRPRNKDFSEEFSVTVVPQVLGQMVVQIGAGVATGGASAWLGAGSTVAWGAGTAVSTGMGVAQGGTEAYTAADKAGASAADRIFAARVGAMTGLIDVLPMGNFMKPLKGPARQLFMQAFLRTIYKGVVPVLGEKVALQITRGTMARLLMQSAKFGSKLGAGMLTEGTTELTQKKINDYAAMISYDPQRKALFISAEDMKDFWGGVIGGGFGGGFEITMDSGNTLQETAIAAEVNKVASLAPYLRFADQNSKKLANTDTDKLFLPMMMLERQIETANESTRTDKGFLEYKNNLIQQQNALMARAQAAKNMSVEMQKFVNNKQKMNATELAALKQQLDAQKVAPATSMTTANVTTSSSGNTNLEYMLNQQGFDQGLVSTLKQKANEAVWNNIVNGKEAADAFIDVLKGRPDLQQNVVKFLLPNDSRRRTFFNQMISKIVDSKVSFIRQQMIENTQRVLEQPDCGM